VASIKKGKRTSGNHPLLESQPHSFFNIVSEVEILLLRFDLPKPYLKLTVGWARFLQVIRAQRLADYLGQVRAKQFERNW